MCHLFECCATCISSAHYLYDCVMLLLFLVRQILLFIPTFECSYSDRDSSDFLSFTSINFMSKQNLLVICHISDKQWIWFFSYLSQVCLICKEIVSFWSKIDKTVNRFNLKYVSKFLSEYAFFQWILLSTYFYRICKKQLKKATKVLEIDVDNRYEKWYISFYTLL